MNKENKTGYLEVLVLGELEAASRTGYELMALLEKKLGHKPSPGSIYPLLSRMFSDKFISVNIKGRKKTYSLTALGKRFLKEKMKEKEYSISKNIALFRSMVRDNFCAKHKVFHVMTMVKVSRKASPETARLLLELKEELLNVLLNEDYSKNEKRLNKKIQESIDAIKMISLPKQKNKENRFKK